MQLACRVTTRYRSGRNLLCVDMQGCASPFFLARCATDFRLKMGKFLLARPELDHPVDWTDTSLGVLPSI